MTSRLTWFTTPQGRTVVGGLATVSACGIFAFNYLPQTVLLNKYHDLVTMRKHGEPLVLTNHLDDLWHDVIEDLSLSDQKIYLLKPFMVFGFDLWHAGSLSSRFGALIGIPINFTYDKLESIKKESINVNNEPVNWNRKDAKQLLQSLILSDNAKKYGIAREILMTDNSYLLIQSLTGPILFGSCYGFAANVNDSLKMFSKPLFLRLTFYALISTFFWGLWAMQKDALTRHYEIETDQALSQLGDNYVKGGVEFYDQMLKRNVALRTLMGTKGESMFSAKGNENFFFRQKRLPVTYRKSYFEEILSNPETTESAVA